MKPSIFAAAVAGAFSLFASVSSAQTEGAFTPCTDAALTGLAGSLCSVTKVPLRPQDPDGEQADLFIRKFPAGPGAKRGEVWLIAGGPGESGASLYPFLDAFRRAFPNRDLLVPDHRGTGFSSKLCPAEESLDSPGGLALTGDEWGPCIGALYADPDRAHAFTITNAAHDLSALIALHRGEGEVQVYGVSYGTQLILRMMQAAPVALDGIVLDGLVPAEATPQGDLSYRTSVVDGVGRKLLSPDQTEAYATLLKTPEQAQIWAEIIPGGDLRQFLGTLLNFPELRDRIPAILDDLNAGEVASLQKARIDLEAAYGKLGAYPQSPPALPLVILMSSSENNARRDLSADTVNAEARDALFVSPLPGLLVNPSVPLYERDAFFGGTPAALPRTLVIHGTLDPNTPYEGAVSHAADLAAKGEVTFAAVEGGAHMLPFVAPECFVRIVSAFSAGQDVPALCSQSALSSGNSDLH